MTCPDYILIKSLLGLDLIFLLFLLLSDTIQVFLNFVYIIDSALLEHHLLTQFSWSLNLMLRLCVLLHLLPTFDCALTVDFYFP